MKYEEMSYRERKEVSEKLVAWLGDYTMEVIARVLSRRDEILENEFAMKLIDELYNREKTHKDKMISSMECLLTDYESFKEFDIHNDPLGHPKAYRDVLYDMYIA